MLINSFSSTERFSSATRQMERVENLLNNMDLLHTSAATCRFHTERLGSVSLPYTSALANTLAIQEAMQPFTSKILKCPFKNLPNPSVAGLRLHLRAGGSQVSAGVSCGK